MSGPYTRFDRLVRKYEAVIHDPEATCQQIQHLCDWVETVAQSLPCRGMDYNHRLIQLHTWAEQSCLPYAERDLGYGWLPIHGA